MCQITCKPGPRGTYRSQEVNRGPNNGDCIDGDGGVRREGGAIKRGCEEGDPAVATDHRNQHSMICEPERQETTANTRTESRLRSAAVPLARPGAGAAERRPSVLVLASRCGRRNEWIAIKPLVK